RSVPVDVPRIDLGRHALDHLDYAPLQAGAVGRVTHLEPHRIARVPLQLVGAVQQVGVVGDDVGRVGAVHVPAAQVRINVARAACVLDPARTLVDVVLRLLDRALRL